MSNEIIEKLRQENELTIEEIYYVLNEIVSITRKYLKEVPIGNAKKCNESDYKIGQICSKFNLAYWPYTTSKLSDDRLFHKFGLIIFNINSKPIIFIMDLTYNQFITDEYEGKGKDSPAFYLDNQLLQKLISNGYLNFTEFNFENLRLIANQRSSLIDMTFLRKKINTYIGSNIWFPFSSFAIL